MDWVVRASKIAPLRVEHPQGPEGEVRTLLGRPDEVQVSYRDFVMVGLDPI